MSAGITEFAYVSLSDEAAPDALNLDTDAGKAVEYMINQVLKHPGARHAHWGMSVEDPKQLRVFVDWDKVQDHLDYRETEAYADVQKYLVPHLNLSAPLSICHIDPAVSSLFSDPTYPTVEILSMCFPGDVDDATKSVVEKQWGEFADKALRAPGLCKTITQGWSVEKDVALPGGEADNKTCVVFLSLIAWESVDQHMQNRELDVFKEARPLLTSLPQLVKLNAVHVNAKSRLAKDAV